MVHEYSGDMLPHMMEYLDENASPEVRAEIERHLADCGQCRVVVNTLRRTVELYRTLPEPDLPDSAREELYKKLDLGQYFKPSR